MSDVMQHEFDRIYKELKHTYPDYGYSQIESRISSYISAEMSKFRHRTDNPGDYTGVRYDPEGKLKIQETESESIEKEDVVFFSSRIPNC
jgi:hypothetical protein